MQLGTRWSVGATPPERIPAIMIEAIQGVEAELVEIDTTQWRWTLTWLENKPVVELDDGTVIRFDQAGGAVTVSSG